MLSRDDRYAGPILRSDGVVYRQVVSREVTNVLLTGRSIVG